MSSLGNMRSRADDRLGNRGDLSSQISEAIADAVRRYEDERFTFNEFWRHTATLSSGATAISFTQLGIHPLQIDRLSVLRTSGGSYGEIPRMSTRSIEDSRDGGGSGAPLGWTIEADAVVFDRTADANYAIVVDGIKRIASASASASDGDSSAWYTAGRDLILAAALKDINMNIVKDDEEAQRCGIAEAEALNRLRGKQVRQRSTGYVRVRPF